MTRPPPSSRSWSGRAGAGVPPQPGRGVLILGFAGSHGVVVSGQGVVVGFVLADETGRHADCARLTMASVDMMFQVLCERGHPLAEDIDFIFYKNIFIHLFSFSSSNSSSNFDIILDIDIQQ